MSQQITMAAFPNAVSNTEHSDPGERNFRSEI